MSKKIDNRSNDWALTEEEKAKKKLSDEAKAKELEAKAELDKAFSIKSLEQSIIAAESHLEFLKKELEQLKPAAPEIDTTKVTKTK